jgi:phosphoglycolate phosphatase
MKYKAVIFDLDGTLLNTLEDLADSVNESLKALGFPEHELAAYKKFVGDGRDILAARALPRDHRDEATVKKLVELIDSEYSERWSNKTLPYEGVSYLLDELTAKKIKFCVLSNKGHTFTELIVSKILSRWRFSAVFGISAETKKKPDPEAALRIARHLGLQSTEILYLGDSDVDMKTATAAKMFAVGAAWGFRTREELVANGAKAVINHPGELLQLLEL